MDRNMKTEEECKHTNIIAVAEKSVRRLRCLDCHLTIKAEELSSGYCPECFEAEGRKRENFEEVPIPDGEKVRYRCEDCKIWIDPET